MPTRMTRCTVAVAAAAAAMAVAIAPIASAAPASGLPRPDTEGPATVQTPGNVQIVAPPRPVKSVFPSSHNPKWSGVGYNPRWPTLGHDPKWVDFGYNPRWNGFQH
jgi:hypothetical protein